VIFVDTSFWAALRNRRDRHHDEAVALLSQPSSGPLLTSDQVRGETWTHVRRRQGHRAAVGLLDFFEQTVRLTVLPVTAEDQEAALAWLRQHDEREYSFVDATSFAVMRRRRITEAFAFDGDFAAAGFVELRP